MRIWFSGRSPQGERGLKLPEFDGYTYENVSLSARRAWIEICRIRRCTTCRTCRSPQGERGLKFRLVQLRPGGYQRRSPQGERGLKYDTLDKIGVENPGRSPQGERGLKSRYPRLTWMRWTVALRKESVD